MNEPVEPERQHRQRKCRQMYPLVTIIRSEILLGIYPVTLILDGVSRAFLFEADLTLDALNACSARVKFESDSRKRKPLERNSSENSDAP